MDMGRLLSEAAGRVAGLGNTAGGQALRRLQHLRFPGLGAASGPEDPERAARRWRAVTVLCSPEQVGTGADLPAPLAAFGDRIEVRITPAPADKGTELAARFRERPSEDHLGELRAALRRAKQLIEVGEVLRVEPQPHGQRAQTPQGAVIDGMDRQAPKEGVL